MIIKRSLVGIRLLSVTALVTAVLGFVFFWWVPMGLIWGLASLVVGFADWTKARRRSLDNRLSIIAMSFALAALAFDLLMAAYQLQTITMGRQL